MSVLFSVLEQTVQDCWPFKAKVMESYGIVFKKTSPMHHSSALSTFFRLGILPEALFATESSLPNSAGSAEGVQAQPGGGRRKGLSDSSDSARHVSASLVFYMDLHSHLDRLSRYEERVLVSSSED